MQMHLDAISHNPDKRAHAVALMDRASRLGIDTLTLSKTITVVGPGKGCTSLPRSCRS